jgi:DNA-binding FrmR family transcriptional regulator
MSRSMPAAQDPHASPGGGSSLHTPEVKEEIRRRINRLSGQIQAIQRMVEEEAYCVEVLQQIAAARGALKKIGSRLLEAHIRHCVLGAARSGSETERRTKIDELVAVFERSMQA